MFSNINLLKHSVDIAQMFCVFWEGPKNNTKRTHYLAMNHFIKVICVNLTFLLVGGARTLHNILIVMHTPSSLTAIVRLQVAVF